MINQQVSQFYLKAEPACKTEVIDAIVLELEAFNDGRPSHDRLKIPSESTSTVSCESSTLMKSAGSAWQQICPETPGMDSQAGSAWTIVRTRRGRHAADARDGGGQ